MSTPLPLPFSPADHQAADQAVRNLLNALAPYPPAVIAANACDSRFRKRLVEKICNMAQCSRPAALAALRRAKILP